MEKVPYFSVLAVRGRLAFQIAANSTEAKEILEWEWKGGDYLLQKKKYYYLRLNIEKSGCHLQMCKLSVIVRTILVDLSIYPLT